MKARPLHEQEKMVVGSSGSPPLRFMRVPGLEKDVASSKLRVDAAKRLSSWLDAKDRLVLWILEILEIGLR
ncbi:hypothetical protein GUJ93_ZPchr0001g32237 [Zizania palustris]|uniref:Uncharacterized protein n=1 Tax=Zizania palustris TaxID=103762 RepID=A0A8J5V5W0_ZIZPA|nr:hypothetical protein GUJ93_ZPchr0001g32237 [Zizania palustris]